MGWEVGCLNVLVQEPADSSWVSLFIPCDCPCRSPRDIHPAALRTNGGMYLNGLVNDFPAVDHGFCGFMLDVLAFMGHHCTSGSLGSQFGGSLK
jgi:hypothetical protein